MTKLFTSEAVAKGHPDKLCDLISDKILMLALQKDSNAKVGIETMATAKSVIVAGECSVKLSEDEVETAIQALLYPIIGKDYVDSIKIINNINLQSSEIF